MTKSKTHEELCPSCVIEEVFDQNVSLEQHIRNLFTMWSTTYSQELRTVHALFQATARLAEGSAEEQKSAKKKAASVKTRAA